MVEEEAEMMASDIGRECYKARSLPEPTRFLPGSDGKLYVLMKRARLGQQLWHPQDANHMIGRRTDARIR